VQLRAHPSVLTWSLANEIRANGVSDQGVYISRAARLARRLDPGRPVAVDVWGKHLPPRAGPLYRAVDVIGGTDYEGWYAHLHVAARRGRRGHPPLARSLRGRYPGKVLVVSEVRRRGRRPQPGGAPGGPGFQGRACWRATSAPTGPTRG
jgi:hypothetical protein